MSRNINAYLSCLRMLVSVERYPESGRFPIISFKGTSCWGRKIAAFYNYLSTAFSWRTVEYSKNAVQDQQVVPLLQKSSNNDSVRRGQYKFYMTYPPVIWGMPLCGQLRPVQPPKWSRPRNDPQLILGMEWYSATKNKILQQRLGSARPLQVLHDVPPFCTRNAAVRKTYSAHQATTSDGQTGPTLIIKKKPSKAKKSR